MVLCPAMCSHRLGWMNATTVTVVQCGVSVCDRLCYCCDRFAACAASLAKSRAPSSAAAVHTYIRQEETLVDPAVYEKEEHKFDFDGRDSRFPKTVAVPEGAHFTFHLLRSDLAYPLGMLRCVSRVVHVAGGIMSVAGLCRRPARLLPRLPKHHAALAVRAGVRQVRASPSRMSLCCGLPRSSRLALPPCWHGRFHIAPAYPRTPMC